MKGKTLADVISAGSKKLQTLGGGGGGSTASAGSGSAAGGAAAEEPAAAEEVSVFLLSHFLCRSIFYLLLPRHLNCRRRRKRSPKTWDLIFSVN